MNTDRNLITDTKPDYNSDRMLLDKVDSNIIFLPKAREDSDHELT